MIKYEALYYREAKEDMLPMRLMWGRFTRKADAIEATNERFNKPLNCASGCTEAVVVNLKTGVVEALWKLQNGVVKREIY